MLGDFESIFSVLALEPKAQMAHDLGDFGDVWSYLHASRIPALPATSSKKACKRQTKAEAVLRPVAALEDLPSLDEASSASDTDGPATSDEDAIVALKASLDSAAKSFSREAASHSDDPSQSPSCFTEEAACFNQCKITHIHRQLQYIPWISAITTGEVS